MTSSNFRNKGKTTEKKGIFRELDSIERADAFTCPLLTMSINRK
jgi:hypothetical protein